MTIINDKQSYLDLNGPSLEIISQPSPSQICNGGSASFVGLTTAVFSTFVDGGQEKGVKNPAVGSGTITYSWYIEANSSLGIGADTRLTNGLFNGATISGSSTPTLTLTNVPIKFNGAKIYFISDYLSSPTTGKSLNGAQKSTSALLEVLPILKIEQQPKSTYSSYWLWNEPDSMDSSVDLATTISISYTDDNGNLVKNDFNPLTAITTRYSNFIPGKEYTIRTTDNIKARVKARGANGGSAPDTIFTGGKGGSAEGVFTFLADTDYKLIVGKSGGDDGSGGQPGGGNAYVDDMVLLATRSQERSDTERATFPIYVNPVCVDTIVSGWYTRTAGSSSTSTTITRQLVVKWRGKVIYNLNSNSPQFNVEADKIRSQGFVQVGAYKYYPSTYRGSQYGWYADGVTCGTAPSGRGDFGNSFDVYRVRSSGGGGGGGYTGLFIDSISKENAIIIAGGGGGGSRNGITFASPDGEEVYRRYSGGDGGGLSGESAFDASNGIGGLGATQTFPGTGHGENSSVYSGSALQGGNGFSGGGGGYFGGGAGDFNGAGAAGGGSGYLHPSLILDSSDPTKDEPPTRIIGPDVDTFISTGYKPKTKSFIYSPKTKQEYEKVTFNVSGLGAITGLYFVFTSLDGKESFRIDNVTQSNGSKTEKYAVKKNTTYNVQCFISNRPQQQGIIKNNIVGNIGKSNQIFADTLGSSNDFDDMRVVCEKGEFESQSPQTIYNDNKDRFLNRNPRTTWVLSYRYDAPVEVISETYTSNELIVDPDGSFEIDFSLSPFVSPSTTAIYNVSASLNDVVNSPNISYQWEIEGGEDLRDGSYETANQEISISVSGSKTNELKITSFVPAELYLRCKVTASNACNSLLYSNYIIYRVSPPRPLVQIEAYNSGGNNSPLAILKEYNLDEDEIIFGSDATGNNYVESRGIRTGLNSDMICIFAEETDLEIEVEMFGAKGKDFSNFKGGEGGYSRLRLTLFKGQEYILKGINTPGALFLYKKSNLIACVASGGDAGQKSNGGRGGGVRTKGDGTQSSSKSGSSDIPIGDVGVFGSSSTQSSLYSGDTKASGTSGGRTIKCTKGVYWKDQGKSPCDNLGQTNFILSNGSPVFNSSIIERGYKDGYSVNQTGGSAVNSTSGKGGDGAWGGDGGRDGNGGSGGSGFFSARERTLVNGLVKEYGDISLKSIVGGSTYSKPRFVLRKAGVFDIETKGKVTHSFNNTSDINLLLLSEGSVDIAGTEGMGAADNLYGFGGNLSGKHYTIKMNFDYRDIIVVPSDYTGGGRYDPDISVARILRGDDQSTWKIWFQRGGSDAGANTYVSFFEVQGVI